MSVVMYMKPGCPYCQRARDYYNEKGIGLIEYDAQNDPQRQKEMLMKKKRPKRKNVFYWFHKKPI